MTLGGNLPSSGRNSSYACLARSSFDAVDERTPEDDSVVRRERIGEHVRAVGLASAVVLRSRLALGIGLDEEAAEIGDQAIDFVGLRLPPCAHGGSSGSAVFRPPISIGPRNATER